MEKYFFSYSRDDAKFSLKLAEDLKNAGAGTWIDQIDIRPGEPWDEEIEKALEASDCLLVILSHSSVASDNVLNEINYAIETKKQLLPVIIESDVKKPFNIRRLQHIDMTASYDTGLSQILKTLNLQEPFNLNGKWSTQELTNPFDKQDKYRLFFDFEVLGIIIVGTVSMVSAIKEANYNIQKGFLDGKITDGTISFYTMESSYVGTDSVSYKNFYYGVVIKEEIKFNLQSDRPWGFPGQKFIATKDLETSSGR